MNKNERINLQINNSWPGQNIKEDKNEKRIRKNKRIRKKMEQDG